MGNESMNDNMKRKHFVFQAGTALLLTEAGAVIGSILLLPLSPTP